MEQISPIWFWATSVRIYPPSLASLGIPETRKVIYLRLSYSSLIWRHFPAILEVLMLMKNKEREAGITGNQPAKNSNHEGVLPICELLVWASASLTTVPSWCR